MEIKQISVSVITPQNLALALKHASPTEFAEFWFEFSRITEKDEKLIDDFARAMTPSSGGHRKRALNKICELMKYYEIKAEKNA
jgi:hypothetical protein